MTEVATPAVPEATPPATPATPAPAPATPVAPAATEETVTLTKEQHDQLARDAARAASMQRKADLYDRHFGNSGSHFKTPAQVTPPTEEEKRVQADAEDKKAERGILAIAADPAFREVLDADPTLRNLMVSNPLAVLPMLANDALDAEDAMSLIKEELGKRKPAPATPPAPAPAPTEVPKPGAITTPTDQTVDEAVETARKNPNTEHAIAGMIGAKVRQGK